MKKKLNFVWIDDELYRSTSAKSMAKNLNAAVKFINVRGKDIKGFSDELERVFQTPLPDLILVDHKLDKLEGDYVSTGSSVAELIRDKLADCPIVGVTAVDIQREINYSKKAIYEDVLSIDKISKSYSTLKVIAQSYKRLKSRRPKNVEELFNLIEAPQDDRGKLSKILPSDLQNRFDDKSLLQRISKWVRHTLMKHPGFLYNELWTATLLGLKLSGFKRIAKIFEGAKYQGVFSVESDPRWWPTRVKEILYKKFPKREYVPLRELSQDLHGVAKKDRSICYACKRILPETVAFVDESSSEEKPMHLTHVYHH